MLGFLQDFNVLCAEQISIQIHLAFYIWKVGNVFQKQNYSDSISTLIYERLSTKSHPKPYTGNFKKSSVNPYSSLSM